MRLQRWFNDHIWRPAKGYTAKDGTWKFVGSSALLFGAIGAVVIAGGGAASHHQASPGLASSRGSRSALGWREPDPTTTTQPPAPPAPPPATRSEPSGRRVPSSTSPRSAPPGLWDCIAEHESGNGRGSANIYQFLPSTWRSAAAENNSPYSSPEVAPPAEQRRVAMAWGAKHGIRNQWTTGAGCGA